MTIRVLLADDHQMMREGLRLVLAQEADIEVVGQADSGREAVHLASELRPDVVVMDVNMPGLNGIEATRQVLRHDASARVIGLSAYADRRYVIQMLECGALGYVLKAGAADELVSAVHAVMRDQSYLSAEIADLASTVRRRSAPSGTVYEMLGAREREVLQLLAEGLSSKQIAAAMSLSVKTVETHRRNIMNKLDIHSIAELTKYALREGLTHLDA